MKTLKSLKTIVLFLTITSILSCNNDDKDIIPDNELVGVWQRNDFSENFEYRLYLNSDYTGYTSSTGYFDDGKVISSAVSLEWITINNQLNLLIGSKKITTPYSFNSDGQLILNGLTDIPFNKLE